MGADGRRVLQYVPLAADDAAGRRAGGTGHATRYADDAWHFLHRGFVTGRSIQRQSHSDKGSRSGAGAGSGRTEEVEGEKGGRRVVAAG